MAVNIIPDREKSGKPKTLTEPFSSNEVNGDVLFVKVHGMSADVAAGAAHTFEFDVPYTKALYNGAEIFSEVKAQTDLIVEVFDGTNYVNYEQYGFDVCAGEVYSRECAYYSIVMVGVRLKCVVTNHASTSKKIGVNFLLHDARQPT